MSTLLLVFRGVKQAFSRTTPAAMEDARKKAEESVKTLDSLGDVEKELLVSRYVELAKRHQRLLANMGTPDSPEGSDDDTKNARTLNDTPTDEAQPKPSTGLTFLTARVLSENPRTNAEEIMDIADDVISEAMRTLRKNINILDKYVLADLGEAYEGLEELREKMKLLDADSDTAVGIKSRIFFEDVSSFYRRVLTMVDIAKSRQPSQPEAMNPSEGESEDSS